MVFTRPDGKYVGRNILNYPFKIIHKEPGIENCRFYNLRGSYATITLRNGIEIRDVADILGHKYIETTENFYITSTDENKKDVSNVFDNLVNSKTINNIIKYEISEKLKYQALHIIATHMDTMDKHMAEAYIVSYADSIDADVENIICYPRNAVNPIIKKYMYESENNSK